MPTAANGPVTLPDALAPLQAQPNWVVWRWETTSQGNRTKVPYQAQDPTRKASTKDSTTWADYQSAAAAAANADGVGFVLTNSNVVAFDIDDCREPTSGAVHPWAQSLVHRVNSYTEITPSGTGLRCIGVGSGVAVHRKLRVADGVTCEIYRKATRYITMTGNVHHDAALANIDAVVDEVLAELTQPEAAAAARQQQASTDDEEDELTRTIRDGGGDRHGASRSEAVWWVINEMLRRGYLLETISKVLADRNNGIADHIYDQADPAGTIERQIAQAKRRITLAVDANNKVVPSQNNVRIALLKMGITLRYDQFSDRVLVHGLDEFGPTLDDAAVLRICLTLEQRFKLRVSLQTVYNIVADTARLNTWHPVRDYLASLQWDGTQRLDRWLVNYGQAQDTEYVRAVGALILVAAVRRVRQPGCKFDEMVVLENPEQGGDKSSAIKTLAVREEWFTDDLPLHLDSKRFIEAMRGHWIAEAGELHGMQRADIEQLKTCLARQVDRARMAYDRTVSEVKRQSVIFGTTNHEEYLRDTTGNRRWWPVRVQTMDIAGLRRDRDQLWAEAAAREAQGASIRLARELWPVAAVEQRARLTLDPYYEALQDALGTMEGKIASTSVWEILDMRPGQRGQEHNRRMGEAMRALGWRRPNNAGLVAIDGRHVSGYVRGDQPWRTVQVSGNGQNLSVTYDGEL